MQESLRQHLAWKIQCACQKPGRSKQLHLTQRKPVVRGMVHKVEVSCKAHFCFHPVFFSMHLKIATLGLQIKFESYSSQAILEFSSGVKLLVSIIFKNIHVFVHKPLLIFQIIPLGNITRREMNGSCLVTFVPNNSCISLEMVGNSEPGKSFIIPFKCKCETFDMNYRSTSMADTE